MRFHRRPSQLIRDGGVLALLTLATSGLFKIAAFTREAFIASQFGLSSFTDAYFAFQQFPLILATFMFGAFGLAFTPAYASEKQRTGTVGWFPGVTIYGGALGVLLTLLVTVSAPWLLRAFGIGNAAHGRSTLIILSCSFAPVIWLGIWAGTTIANGKNVLAMFVTGLPYLTMTALLVGLYGFGQLVPLSLPISFLVGFGVIGLCTLPALISAAGHADYIQGVTGTWKMPGFRGFLRQLGASSLENLGYAGNQLLLVYFVAQEGTGAVSANICAMRVGMLGLSLLSLPLTQLLQAKLCEAREGEHETVLTKWLIAIAGTVGTFALLLYVLRVPVTGLVYLHGNFSAVELGRVTAIIPPWIAYFLIVSLNLALARYFFSTNQGGNYVRRQLCAYAAANLIRVLFWGRLGPGLIVWCSVLAEGCALLLNLRAAFTKARPRMWPARFGRVVVHTPEPGAGAGQYVAEFVKALAAAGLPVTLFCPGNFAYEQEVQASGAYVVRAPIREIVPATFWRRVVRNVDFSARAVRQFAATVRHGDIVHFQFKLHFGLSLLYFAVARLKRTAIVLTVHDPLPHHWILPLPLRWLEMALLTFEYSLCSRLIVHNETGKRILAKHFRLACKSVTVVPHGPLSAVPIGSTDQVLPTEADPLRLLAFGSLRQNKGLHLLIAAVQHLLDETMTRPVVLTIAGCISNAKERAYWQRCRRLIERRPAGIKVLQHTVSDSAIRSLFEAHDAVVLPYIDFYSESGVAILSLCQRRPIIATSAGGLGELLRETDCGILIERPTVESVVAAIREAASTPTELLRRKGLNGYSYALTHRSWEYIAERTAGVYRSLTSEKQPVDAEATVVIHTPEPSSSAALYIEELSAALTEEKVRVRVVCPANHGARAAMESNLLIEVCACCERATSINVTLLAKFAENLRFVLSSCKALLNATKPGDLVHFQYILHLPFGLIFFACASAKRARIAFTVHDPIPHKFLFPRILRAIETGALRLAYKWSDVLIVHSDAGKRKLTEAFGIAPQKIRVIVHGPYELKEKVRACSESSRLEVLFFGSLRENKGLHLAIEACQQLARDGAPLRLTIAGQVVNRKEEAYWQRCRKLIDSSSAAICLKEGFVPHEKLADLFSSCHCFLLPYTTYSSDSGVAYMALANGKPIVSTDAGGLGWLLENSGAAIPISEPSVAGVIAALRQALELGPGILERMGRAGSRWVSAECGWRTVARETRQVYQEFIGQKAESISGEKLQECAELVGACDE